MTAGVDVSLSRALNEAIREQMRCDERVILLGEDIGVLGGVFRVTDGLAAEFGDRVLDTPLAESAIVGTAIGLALRGYRPVCEIQFDGFVYPAFDQIVSQLAKLRARSRGLVKMPVTIRIPVGGGIGAVEHHSESNEAYFCHTAGLRVVACADPAGAYDLLRAAIACDDPVIFYEPKRRYWDTGQLVADTVVSPVVLESARILREGTDVTMFCYGATVALAIGAADVAASEGKSVEVVDLQSLSPLDTEALTRSVAKTGRVVVVHEAQVSFGVGAEVAALVAQHCFYDLEAPVERVGGYDVPYPPARAELDYLPDLDRVLDAVDRVCAA